MALVGFWIHIEIETVQDIPAVPVGFEIFIIDIQMKN